MANSIIQIRKMRLRRIVLPGIVLLAIREAEVGTRQSSSRTCALNYRKNCAKCDNKHMSSVLWGHRGQDIYHFA